MNTDVTVLLRPLVDRRDVGKPNQRLGEWTGCQVWQQARRAVTAASREHSGDSRVAKSRIQLVQAALIGAGQVSVFLEDPRIVLDAVAIGDDGKTGLKGLAVEGAGGRYDGDRIAGAQGSGFMKNGLSPTVP